jgi:ubiquinone biosynthesis protein COQ4
MATFQFQPVRALRAARKLLADPNDLPQMYTIIDSLSCDTLARVTRRLRGSEEGRRLLGAQPDIAERLVDRGALASLPEGSVGRVYLDLAIRAKISIEGILAASALGTSNTVPLDPPLDWTYARLRDTHDLWHVVTGYSTDLLGETALLAFYFAQLWNPALGLALLLGIAKTAGPAQGGADARRTIVEGFKRGLRAKWLPAQPWEQLLEQPLHAVRTRLLLGDAPIYTAVPSEGRNAA